MVTLFMGAVGLASPFLIWLDAAGGFPVPVRAYGSWLGVIMSEPGTMVTRALFHGGDGPVWFFLIPNALLYAVVGFALTTIVQWTRYQR